jgi:hypothetical protein
MATHPGCVYVLNVDAEMCLTLIDCPQEKPKGLTFGFLALMSALPQMTTS